MSSLLPCAGTPPELRPNRRAHTRQSHLVADTILRPMDSKYVTTGYDQTPKYALIIVEDMR